MSSMAIILVVLSAVFACALGLHAYKQFNIRRRRRISENEYAVAVTIWEYGRLVKGEIDDAIRQGACVIDFTKIAIPHSHGYRVSLELTASYFRVYATPDRYARTGKLSFVADDSLTVRAADRAGEPATPDDPEYKGDSDE
ncbi:MAG TPA: hypothetical protein VF762_07995 [Blastocatellia bacterium]